MLPGENPLPQKNLLLLSFSGDLTTKAPPTRRRMTSRLVENLRTSIRSSGRRAKVIRERNRIFIELAERPEAKADTLPSDEEIAERLARVFGIQSISPALSISWDSLEDIVQAGTDFGKELVRGRRFAVRARNVGDHGVKKVRSFEAERALGAALNEFASGVDLGNPETTIFVEITPARVFLFSNKGMAAGGLPLGTAGRAVSLLSGGFDSPVASWRMLRRGISLDYVFCNLGGRAHQLETMTVAKRLSEFWQQGTLPRFFALDFDEVTREIQKNVEMRFWQVVLKRQMVRAAEAVALHVDGAAIITGDAIAQVSSQTLQNLSVISDGACLPILRPLIGNNKQEIIAESKIVGTHDLSAKVGEYCAIVPKRPSTHAYLEDILAAEARMDPEVLSRAIERIDSFRLDEIDLEAWSDADLKTRTIEKGDVVIDLRPRPEFDEWHYPDALFLEFSQALEAYGSFDAHQRYVAYCEFGLKSAHLADLMRRAGLEAKHISGGLRAVQKLADQLTS